MLRHRPGVLGVAPAAADAATRQPDEEGAAACMEPFALQGVEGLDDGQGQRYQGGHALGGLVRDDSVSLPAEPQRRQDPPLPSDGSVAMSASDRGREACRARSARSSAHLSVPTGEGAVISGLVALLLAQDLVDVVL